MVYSTVLVHGWSWVQAPNIHQCLWTCLQVCGSKRLDCHADLFTVSRCHSRGELHRQEGMKGIHLALKPRADITRSPKRVSLAPQKGLSKKKFTRDKSCLLEQRPFVNSSENNFTCYCILMSFLVNFCIAPLFSKQTNGSITNCDDSFENKRTWPLWYRDPFQDKCSLNTKWSRSVDLFLPGACFLGDMRKTCCTERSKYLLYWIQLQQGRQRSFVLSQQHMAILQFE